MLLVLLKDNARVMVCDEVCLRAVHDRLPDPALVYDGADFPACMTCFHCGLTLPDDECACAALDLSCTAGSWLLTYHPFAALDAVFEALGITLLDDDDWDALIDLGEQVTHGGLAGALWAREHEPPRDR